MPEPTPAWNGGLHWRACGNPWSQRHTLVLSSALALMAIWLCAGGFAGWLESCPALMALACWSMVLLLHLQILQIRSRRLWLSGSSLVYQSILLGFVGDVSTLTALRGERSLSGSLRELVLVRRDGPLLRLRATDWHEQDLRALIAALLRLKPRIEVDALVTTYAGIAGRDPADGAATTAAAAAVWR